MENAYGYFFILGGVFVGECINIVLMNEIVCYVVIVCLGNDEVCVEVMSKK